MKKLSLLIIVLLAFGLTFVGAQVIEAPAVSGTAAVTFGINLDNNSTGFNANSASSSWSVTLFEGASGEAGGEGVYGWIKVTDAYAKLNQGAHDFGAGSVEAKLMMDPLWIKISSVPDATANLVTPVAGTDVTTVQTENGGLIIGFSAAPLSLEIAVASQADYDSNTANAYALGTKLTLAVDPLTIEAAFGTGTLSTDPMGIGVKASLSSGSLAAFAGYDMNMTSGAYEAVVQSVLTIVDDGDDDTTLTIDGSYGYDGTTRTDAKVTFVEAASDHGLAPVIGATLTVSMLDLTSSAMTIPLALNTTYDLGEVDPYANISIDDVTATNMTLGLTAGIDFSMIPNTVFKLEYVNAALVAPATTNGTITFTTTISL